jgi:hypothetical protein
MSRDEVALDLLEQNERLGGEVERLRAERDALKAAVERVRALCERWKRGRGTDRFSWIVLRAILGTLELVESNAGALTPANPGSTMGGEASEAHGGSRD